MSQEELLQRLFGPSSPPPSPTQALPDWAYVHRELRRKNVTLYLLWKEYRQNHRDGYSYSRFCELYQSWAETVDPPIRFPHLPGEKMFVDWAGQTVPIHHPDGTLSAASLFVAVLGFSNKTFAEAFPNQQLPSWIAAHCKAYAYYGGVSKVTVPDNTRTAVIKALSLRTDPPSHLPGHGCPLRHGRHPRPPKKGAG